jgi:hypothetical protein
LRWQAAARSASIPTKGGAWVVTGPGLKEAGLAELAGLKALRKLNIQGVNLTQAGLKELSGFKHLQALSIRNTNLSRADIEKLRLALPGCQVSY